MSETFCTMLESGK